MRILGFRIRRVREIDELDVECGDVSLIAIIGENGAGKTTVLFSLLFALTGVLILKGSKDEHVRDTGEGPSWVEVKFEHAGVIYVVRRAMNASTVKLTVGEGDAAEKVNGSNKVNQRLLEDGIDPARILQAFLPQGDADKLFKATDGDRAKEALKTFGLAEIEILGDALGKAATPLREQIDTTVRERFDVAEAQLGMVTKRQVELKPDYDKADTDYKALNEAQFILQRASRIKIANERYTELKALHSNSDEERDRLKNTYDTALETVNRHQEDLNNSAETYDSMKERLYAHDQFIKNQSQRETIEVELKDHESIMGNIDTATQGFTGKLLPEEIFNKYTDVTLTADDKLSLLRSASAAQAKAGEAKDFADQAVATTSMAVDKLATFDAIPEMEADLQAFQNQLAVWKHQSEHSKDGKCATCGQDWADAAASDLAAQMAEVTEVAATVSGRIAGAREAAQNLARLQQSQAQLESTAQEHLEGFNGFLKQIENTIPGHTDVGVSIESIEKDTEEAHAAVDAHKATLYDLEQANKDKEILQAKIDGAKRSLSSMQGSNMSPEEQEKAHQLITAYDEKKLAMQTAATERDSLNTRIYDLDDKVASYATEMEQVQSQMEAGEEDEKDIETAKDLIKNLEAIQANWTAMSNKWAEFSKESELFTAQVEDLQSRMKKQEVLQKKLDIIAGARHILHREQLPLFVCSLYTELVSQQWATELESFGCRFTAWQDPSTLEFYARFEDGNERRVYQLSGGERQLAIVAYLFVINRLFSPDLNIIGFDEPTTHVDETFRPIMAEVFRKLAERADEEGMQIFLVDHAPEFLTTFPAALHLRKQTA